MRLFLVLFFSSAFDHHPCCNDTVLFLLGKAVVSFFLFVSCYIHLYMYSLQVVPKLSMTLTSQIVFPFFLFFSVTRLEYSK